MRVSEFFGGLFTGLFSLVQRVVQPCSLSEIPVFMRVSEFLEGCSQGCSPVMPILRRLKKSLHLPLYSDIGCLTGSEVTDKSYRLL